MNDQHDAIALAARLRAVLKGKRQLSEKKMFGGVCFLLHEHMLCGSSKRGFLFRVGKEQDAAALESTGAMPMVHNGRRMQGFIWVDPASCDSRALARWIKLAAAYIATLPPKGK